MSDDLLTRIDQATDEWDTWDGTSPDAMRWAPEGRMSSAYVVLHIPPEEVAHLELLRQAFQDMARAVVVAFDAAQLQVRQVAAVVEEARQRARPKHVPPMWADVPTKQRRRR